MQKEIREKSIEYFKKAGIFITDEEKKDKIQIFDCGMGDFYKLGLVVVTFIDTLRYCGKFLLFFPGQSAAEHSHPGFGENIGTEETFRVLWGTAYAYGEGEPTENIKAKIPEGKEKCFTSRKESILKSGEQYTVGLHEKHWWQAGPDGVVVLEVSSASNDSVTAFTDDTLDFKIY